MSVETSAVQISVNVVDNTSSQVLSGVEQNLNKLGAAGTRSGAQVEQGMRQAGAGMLSATEKTRLAAEEMGVRLPRAMITLIGQSKAAQAVLSTLSTAMIGFATIQIGAMIFTAAVAGAQKLWKELTGLSKATQDYRDEVAKTKDENFGNTHSIETTRLRIDEASEAVRRYTELSRTAGATWLWSAKHEQLAAADTAIGWQKKLDTLQHSAEAEQAHKQRSSDIELWSAQREADISKMPESARPKAKRDFQVEEARKKAHEERFYGTEQDRALRNPVAANAGADEENRAVTIATLKADTELADSRKGHTSDAKSQVAELARLHEQALESGLRGSALYHLQEAEAIEDLKRRGITSAQAVADVHAKFHNEEMNRLRAQQSETEKMGRMASMAGMTGIQKTQAEGANRAADINADENLDPTERAKRFIYANQQTNQQIEEQQRSFAQEINALNDSTAAHQVQGFARIHAEAAQHLDALQKKFDETYGHMDRSTPGGAAQYGAGLSQLQRGQGLIASGETGQSKELTQKNAQETAQIEEQARVKFLSAEKQKTAAIGAELAERKQKYLDELNSQEISQDDYNRRVAAAQMEANGQMIEAASEARKKMAGEFTGFFEGMEHPGKYFAKLGDKAAGEAAASLFQRFQGGKGGAGADSKGGAGGVFGDVLGGMGFGVFGKKGKGAGADAKAEMSAGHGAHGAAEKAFSITSATIHIGSAMITGGGGPGGGPGGGGGGVGPGGGTTLLAPRVTGATGGFGAGAPSTSAGSSAWSAGGSTVGGAGAGVAGSIASGLAEPGVGPGPSKSVQVKGALGDASQGVALTKQLGKDFSGQSGNGKSGGDPTKTSSGNGSMTSDGFSQANVTGAAQGAMGVWGAHESGGGVGGGLKGAMSGAEMGMEIAGPVGALVGAAAGAVVGAIGSSHAARDYDLKTVRPRIAGDLSSYHSGGMNYLDAYSDAQSLQMEAAKTTQKMGSADSRYYQNTIKPEIKEFMGKLDAEQKAGRSMYTASGASYATGTPYVPETGLNMNHAGERIFSSVDNSAITKAVTEGNGGKMPVQSTSMGDVHLHVHAIDAKGVSQFLDKYKHNIRSAVNDSYAENSGGGMN